ncbi:MAG: TonB-dependent receptor [Gemmatimonadota bacterium]|nr:TonB-dependent receptor [Gemmatimonadota bacterium]
MLARARRTLATSVFALAFCAVAVPALAQGGAIAGTVSSSAGPMAGITVHLTSGPNRVATTTTAADGSYRLGGVAAGSYVVIATSPGYTPARHVVTVAAGASVTADLTLVELMIQLDPSVTTASRGASATRSLDVPASISVVPSTDLGNRPVPIITDYLKTLPGISVVNGGIAQSNTVSRGFNYAFSTSMLSLQDYRFNALPSLRGNLPFLNTGTTEDIERIEVLNGPAAALYGPNAANGVLHIISKSPFTSQGTSLTVDGGERNLMRIAGRTATVFGGGRWGAKLSSEYFTANEWPDRDPNLPATYPATAPAGRAGLPLHRGTLARRWNAEGRLDYRNEATGFENMFTAGHTHILNSQELTAVFGPTQGRNWTYTSLQDRVKYKQFNAQVFYNGSNSGSEGANDLSGSYYLTTGIPIVDQSSVVVAQAQQGFDLWGANFITGADYIATHPKSNGTVYGRYETTSLLGNTDITESGAYLHGTFHLPMHVDFVAAGRVDQSNRLDGTQFSPRLALVYKPDDVNSFRFTFGRAFNSPAGFAYFLDQVSNPQYAPGFALRAIGNPSKVGLQFNRSCDAGVNLGLCMHSPWVGAAPVASSAANAFPGFVAALPAIVNALPTLSASDKAALGGLLAQLKPILSSLRPTPSEVGTTLMTTAPVQASAVRDIAPLTASFNNTWELGYKGIVGSRLRVSLDLWHQIRGDVGQTLGLAHPLVLYEPTSLGAYLVAKITQGLMAGGMSQAQAQATAQASAAALVPLMAALPQGTLAFTSPLDDGSILVTYQNSPGEVKVTGADLAVDYQANADLLLSATYSIQDKVVFDVTAGGGGQLMSNSPKHRVSVRGRWRGELPGWGMEGTVRYSDAFPVNSGYYNSLNPNLYNPAFKPLNPVPAQTLLDAGVSYHWEAPRLTWGLTVTNLLDTKAPTFAGTPYIRRLALSRLSWAF